MRFDECKNFYRNIDEAIKESPMRKELYERNKDFLESFETTMFDKYNVESVYITDDFFDMDIFCPSRMPLYWKMGQKQFEEFVDSRQAETLSEQFDLYVQANNGFFHFNNGFWKLEDDKIIKKEIWI